MSVAFLEVSLTFIATSALDLIWFRFSTSPLAALWYPAYWYNPAGDHTSTSLQVSLTFIATSALDLIWFRFSSLAALW